VQELVGEPVAVPGAVEEPVQSLVGVAHPEEAAEHPEPAGGEPVTVRQPDVLGVEVRPGSPPVT
jgi:hypothetical protein